MKHQTPIYLAVVCRFRSLALLRRRRKTHVSGRTQDCHASRHAWATAGVLPAGAKMAVIDGDPRKGVIHDPLKMPPATDTAHTHPTPERITVISAWSVSGSARSSTTPRAADESGRLRGRARAASRTSRGQKAKL
jgi:hypothetical protein